MELRSGLTEVGTNSKLTSCLGILADLPAQDSSVGTHASKNDSHVELRNFKSVLAVELTEDFHRVKPVEHERRKIQTLHIAHQPKAGDHLSAHLEQRNVEVHVRGDSIHEALRICRQGHGLVSNLLDLHFGSNRMASTCRSQGEGDMSGFGQAKGRRQRGGREECVGAAGRCEEKNGAHGRCVYAWISKSYMWKKRVGTTLFSFTPPLSVPVRLPLKNR